MPFAVKRFLLAEKKEIKFIPKNSSSSVEFNWKGIFCYAFHISKKITKKKIIYLVSWTFDETLKNIHRGRSTKDESFKRFIIRFSFYVQPKIFHFLRNAFFFPEYQNQKSCFSCKASNVICFLNS